MLYQMLNGKLYVAPGTFDQTDSLHSISHV